MIVNFLGLDLGTAQDNAVLCISQRVWREVERPWDGTEWTGTHHVRMLRQYALGTPYPSILEDLKIILKDPRLPKAETAVIMDATGVGLPVYQEAVISGIPALGVIITSGNAPTETEIGYNVPKRDLVMAVKIALESRRLRFSRGLDHQKALVHQLQRFTIRHTRSQNLTFEAERERDHDDIVMALALNVWYDRYLIPYDMSPPELTSKAPKEEHILDFGLK